MTPAAASWTTRATRSACSRRCSSRPIVASNGVSDLPKALAYARTHGGPDVTLAAGTEAFTGSLVG